MYSDPKIVTTDNCLSDKQLFQLLCDLGATPDSPCTTCPPSHCKHLGEAQTPAFVAACHDQPDVLRLLKGSLGVDLNGMVLNASVFVCAVSFLRVSFSTW